MNKNKFYKRRLRKRKRILKFILFLLIITLLYLFIFKTKFFNIKIIDVLGNHNMSYENIVKASLCIKGENIFKINKKLGEENLNRLPYIKKSKIKRRYPSKIVIEVEEKQEIGIIPYIGSFIYIDDEGYSLKIEEKKGDVNLPQIFGLEFSNVELGEKLFEQLQDKGVEEFIGLGNQSEMLKLMKYINFTDKNNIMIELHDGIKVAFGALDNVKYKLSFLYNILEDVEEKDLNIKKIFLNKGDNPVIVLDK